MITPPKVTNKKQQFFNNLIGSFEPFLRVNPVVRKKINDSS